MVFGMERIISLIDELFTKISLPKIGITDIVEIIILSAIIYSVIKWVRTTRAWPLVKGLAVIMGFWVAAVIFELNVIQWLITNTISVGIIALIIVFQPEFRKALEQLGQKNFIGSLLNLDDVKNEQATFSDHTINEIVRATFELAKVKTGALIVLTCEVPLTDFENTGIPLDSLISSQLLINIFEHNTPLHDGAVIIKRDRITSATCYLPLCENNQLSKELGTRHRAGVGITEVTDAFTIIVSEQTGKVSVAKAGKLSRNIDGETLRNRLYDIQNKKSIDVKKIRLWKGRIKNERKAD